MHKMPISRFGSKMKRKKIYSSFVNHQEQNKHFFLPCYKEIEFSPSFISNQNSSFDDPTEL